MRPKEDVQGKAPRLADALSTQQDRNNYTNEHEVKGSSGEILVILSGLRRISSLVVAPEIQRRVSPPSGLRCRLPRSFPREGQEGRTTSV